MELVQGYRVLAGSAPDPAWTVEAAHAETGLRRAGSSVVVDTHVRLRVRALRPTDTLALAFPDVEPDPLDVGGDGFATDWTLDRVEDEAGAPLRSTAPPPSGWDADRRTVLVRWADPWDAGRVRTLDLHWTQALPFGRVEGLRGVALGAGVDTPLTPALPRLVADRSPFPYVWRARAPATLRLAPSGRIVDETSGGDVRTLTVEGDDGAHAAWALGRWEVGRVGDLERYAETAADAAAEALTGLRSPISAWSGLPLGPLRYVPLPRTWRSPHAEAAGTVFGVRRAVRLPGVTGGAPSQELPGLPTVLTVTGAAQASWAGRGAPSAAGDAWVGAFARAFALDLLDADDASAWRAWLQTCIRPVPGLHPALSPEVSGTSPFRRTSTECAGPLLVGPMLDDRLGAADARLVRRAVFGAGRIDADTLTTELLRHAPDARPWASRWLRGGEPVDLRLTWTAAGTHVTGVLHGDTELAGAPIVVRFRAGLRTADVTLRGDGAELPLDTTLPFVPRHAAIDPDHRVLRLP